MITSSTCARKKRDTPPPHHRCKDRCKDTYKWWSWRSLRHHEEPQARVLSRDSDRDSDRDRDKDLLELELDLNLEWLPWLLWLL
jgi:hypothetical protein